MLVDWNDQNVGKLKHFWEETNLSATAIAEEFGDVKLKNAVISKANREGFKARLKGNRYTRRGPSQLARMINDTLDVPPEEPKTKEQCHAAVLALREHHCRWPIGDPGQPGFAFCSEHRICDSSYCRQHTLLSYQPRSRRGAA